VRQRSGAVTLEFAMVALPFLVLLLGVMEVGYDLFVDAALDYAVSVAARSVQIGSVQGTSGETSATLAAAAVCPSVAGLLSCSNVIVAVAPLTTGSDYYSGSGTISWSSATSSSGVVCTGTSGQMMMMTAWYAGPTFLGSLIPAFATTYNGNTVHLSSASAGFINQSFTGGQTTGSGC
jgi:Flp pilus assembly protein TadG